MRNGNGNNGYMKGYLGGTIIRLDNVWILGWDEKGEGVRTPPD